MLTCKCGQEYETPTKLKVHQLSGNCGKSTPVVRRREGISALATGYLAKPTGVKRQPRQKYPDRHGELIFETPTGEWHLPISIYYSVPRDHTGSPEELTALLGHIERRIRAAIKQIVLEELPEVRVKRIRVGNNASHCRLNTMQTLFKGKGKGKKGRQSREENFGLPS